VTNGSGSLTLGSTALMTLYLSEQVTVTGSPTLSLNDGGIATYMGDPAPGNAIVFSYTIGDNQNTDDLRIIALNLNGGTIQDVSGDPIATGGAVVHPPGIVQIGTGVPGLNLRTDGFGGGTSAPARRPHRPHPTSAFYRFAVKWKNGTGTQTQHDVPKRDINVKVNDVKQATDETTPNVSVDMSAAQDQPRVAATTPTRTGKY
jgi:hypothetical protein